MESKKLSDGSTYTTGSLSEGKTVMAGVMASIKTKWSKRPSKGTPRQRGPLGTYFNGLQRGSNR